MSSRGPNYTEDVSPHIFASGPGLKRLAVAIVGADIAGLGAATGICPSAHDVEVPRELQCPTGVS